MEKIKAKFISIITQRGIKENADYDDMAGPILVCVLFGLLLCCVNSSPDLAERKGPLRLYLWVRDNRVFGYLLYNIADVEEGLARGVVQDNIDSRLLAAAVHVPGLYLDLHRSDELAWRSLVARHDCLVNHHCHQVLRVRTGHGRQEVLDCLPHLSLLLRLHAPHSLLTHSLYNFITLTPITS